MAFPQLYLNTVLPGLICGGLCFLAAATFLIWVSAQRGLSHSSCGRVQPQMPCLHALHGDTSACSSQGL